MSPTDWAGVAVSTVTIIGSFAASVRWLVKHYLSELKPDGNGGHNFEGRLARVERRVDEIFTFLVEKK